MAGEGAAGDAIRLSPRWGITESPAKFDDFDVRPRWFYPLANVYITMEIYHF